MPKIVVFAIFVGVAGLSLSLRWTSFLPKKDSERERLEFWRKDAELPLFLAVYPLFPVLCIVWSALGVGGVLSPALKLATVVPLAIVLPYLWVRRRAHRERLSEDMAKNVLRPLQIAIWLYATTVAWEVYQAVIALRGDGA